MDNIIDEIKSGRHKNIESIAKTHNVNINHIIKILKSNSKYKSINKSVLTVFSYKTLIILLQTHSLTEIATQYGMSYNEVKYELSKHNLSYNDFKPYKENVLFLSETLHFGADELCKYYNINYNDITSFNTNNNIKLKREKTNEEIIPIDDFCVLYCNYKLSLNQISKIYNIGIQRIRKIKKEYEKVKPELSPQIRTKLSDTKFKYIRNLVKLNIL